jgi:regulator of protease activity HflC (stomatin/prohibitin superfamily)
MQQRESHSVQPTEPVVPRSHRLVRRLALVYGAAAVVSAGFFFAALLPAGVLPRTNALASELVVGGVGGTTLATLLLAATALAAVLVLTTARLRHAAAAPPAGSRSRAWRLTDPGFAARQGQSVVLPVGALLIWVAARLLWPAAVPVTSSATANVAAGLVFILAFVSLIAERTLREFPTPQLPEAPQLRRVLLLTTVLLTAAACIEIGRGAALDWVRWPTFVLICVPGVIAVELALRAAARLFLPPRSAADARAATDSILAGLITGGPRAPATLLRTHFGLDFARSWALSFLTAAILPAVFGTALLCWTLSGLKLIDLEQRGVYERFGAPVAVLGPGLHLLLPWPLGRLRPVEFGAIHALAVGVDEMEPAAEDIELGAEATTPITLNRLWETAHPGQANYLVPSPGTGQQGFQTVSTEISVLYRVGLTDDAALEFLYSVSDPQALVKNVANRLVLEYFNSRTLEAVLGARRENVAETLREELRKDLDLHKAGIDIVSVLIEEVHPPAGAAAAYHAVQAAEINASASIFDEVGKAKRTAGVADQEAYQLTSAAEATAAETTRTADGEAYRFKADRSAYKSGAEAFLLERYYSSLRTALAKTPLTIIDHRLNADQGPVFDLRSIPGAAGGAAGAASGAGAPPRSAATLPPFIPGAEDNR